MFPLANVIWSTNIDEQKLKPGLYHIGENADCM